VRVGARRRGQRQAEHADHDRQHAQVLVAPGALAEQALAGQHQHEQAGGERRLHDHQRGQQQRHDLQGKAKDRQAGAEQPAGARDQPAQQRQAQVGLVGHFAGVQRLKGDA